MTPEDLARRYSILYHVTAPSAWPSIRKHGLLPTSQLLALFEIPAEQQIAIQRGRRLETLHLEHPRHGHAEITDNRPINFKSLTTRLDDGLTPQDWMAMLNSRVFFWADKAGRDSLLKARANRGREKLILEVDTLSIVSQYAGDTELTAFNTGATLRGGPRRGRHTFSKLSTYEYAEWRVLRGKSDKVREVTIVGRSINIVPHLLRRYIVAGG